MSRALAAFHLDRLVDIGLLDAGFRRPAARATRGAGRPPKVYRRSTRQIDVTLPRREYALVEKSRATPPVDDVAVWVIPCITVRRGHRGQGVAVAMIRAAVEYAGKHGAPAVEAHPRADGKRVHDDFAFFGTQAMFRKAGFRRVRGILPGLPKGWTPRVTMRATCGSSPKTSSASPRRSKPAR
ncbi:MAG: GNAT family N-acetyltransferase [Chloroflexi bacterium]|nr:MAG: GNAT family N-acetyltransferase [Chloroflexota bacterium]